MSGIARPIHVSPTRVGRVSNHTLNILPQAPSNLSPPLQVCFFVKRAAAGPGHAFRHPSAQQTILGDFGGKNALRTLIRCVKLRQVYLISYEQ